MSSFRRVAWIADDSRKLGHTNAMNQPVATVDYPLEKRLIATRLHSFVMW